MLINDLKRVAFLKELQNKENWKPNHTNLSKKLGMNTGSCHALFKRFEREGRIKLVKVEILSDFELYERETKNGKQN